MYILSSLPQERLFDQLRGPCYSPVDLGGVRRRRKIKGRHKVDRVQEGRVRITRMAWRIACHPREDRRSQFVEMDLRNMLWGEQLIFNILKVTFICYLRSETQPFCSEEVRFVLRHMDRSTRRTASCSLAQAIYPISTTRSCDP
jgi:hypothetical protein